jgi:hypothetical protein
MGLDVPRSKFGELDTVSCNHGAWMFNKPIYFGIIPLALLSPTFGHIEDDFHCCAHSELGLKEFAQTCHLTFSMSKPFSDQTTSKKPLPQLAGDPLRCEGQAVDGRLGAR